jgi:hypothetical protein
MKFRLDSFRRNVLPVPPGWRRIERDESGGASLVGSAMRRDAIVCVYRESRYTLRVHLAISPVLLGSGEHLFAGIDAATLGY